jgi:serine/threonine protein kinase
MDSVGAIRMSEHPKHALPIGYVIGGYEIARVIGQGGFGIVYEARNPVTLEHVAIKEFYPTAIATRQEATIVLYDEEERDILTQVLNSFRDEAKLQFDLNHRNLLKVRNYVSASNTGYVISDYIEGPPLRGYLKKFGGYFPNYNMFQTIMEPIVGAVGYLHRKGILHRDISPDNILVDEFGKATLIDLGSAKHDLRASTLSGIVRVREDYTPPEQYEPSLDRPEGYYTDIFSLAGTFYCVLAGKPSKRALQRLTAALDSYVPIAQVSKVFCPEQVYRAIDRGLSLAVKERPATIEEFADMLGWQPDYGSEQISVLPPLLAPPGMHSIDAGGTRAASAPMEIVNQRNDEVLVATASSVLPDQSPAPVRVEERAGKIARVQDRDSPLLTAERDFDAWREPIAGHVRELLSGDFRQGTNHSRARDRLVELGKLLAGSVADVNERQFRLGYEIARLEGLVAAYRSGAEDMPALNAAVLEDIDRMRLALQVGVSKLERWAEFIRQAAGDPKREGNANPLAIGEALDKIAIEMERQSKYFDPELPITFRFLAESVKDPLGATRTVVYGAVKSAENLISFLGQRTLGIGKSSVEAVDKHISRAIATSLLISLSGAALQLSGALPTAWVWLKPLLDALTKAGAG